MEMKKSLWADIAKAVITHDEDVESIHVKLADGKERKLTLKTGESITLPNGDQSEQQSLNWQTC